MAFAALVLAALSIFMARSVMFGQVGIADSMGRLIENNDSLTLAIASSTANTKPTEIDEVSKKLAPRKPRVRLARVPLEVSSDSLEFELQQTATLLKVQYPQSAEAIHVVALFKAQTRKFAEARDLWLESSRLDPNKESYLVNLATLAMEQGDYQLAVDTLSSAKANGRRTTDLEYHLAIALSKLGRHDEVVAIANKMIEKNPKASSFYGLLGQSFLETSNNEEAEANFRKALDLGEASPSVLIGLGNACMRLGKRDEAAVFFAKYAETKKDTLTGHERYKMLTEKDIKKTALVVFSEAALVHFRNKDLLQAEHLLSRCIAISPDSVSSLLALADYYNKTKMPAEELAVRERIMELSPTMFNQYLSIAKIQSNMGDRESAEATLKLVATLDPLSGDSFSILSQFQMESGNRESARWYAQRSLERQPSAEGFRFLAAICKTLNDRDGEADATKCAQQLETQP